MSKLLFAAAAGYMLGMKHRMISKELCWARMKKRLRQMARFF